MCARTTSARAAPESGQVLATRLELSEGRVKLLSNQVRQRFRLMVRQDLAQIAVDSREEVLVRNEVRTQRELGAEIAGLPVVVAAVVRSVCTRPGTDPRPPSAKVSSAGGPVRASPSPTDVERVGPIVSAAGSIAFPCILDLARRMH